MDNYYAVRTMTAKDRNGPRCHRAWKVLSRPMADRASCISWLNFCKTESRTPERYNWFVVKIEEDV